MISRGQLLCADLVCWGAASPPLFADYLEWVGRRSGSEVVSFKHRAKSAEWDGTRPEAVLAGGKRLHSGDADLWQRLWYGLCRPSCYACGFHSVERPGNVTIGDYWGLDKAHPDLQPGNGTSCLIVNDEAGMELVRACGDKLRVVPSRMDLCANDAQPMLDHPPNADLGKDAFWRSYSDGGFDSGVREAGAMPKRSLVAPVKRAIKYVVRSLQGKGAMSEPRSADGWEEAVMAGSVGEKAREYPLVFAAKNTSPEVLQKSASGGMFHALASTVIEQSGVVYGCAFDEHLSACHIRCETMEEVERCMGSKYSQSRMGDAIARIKGDLEAGRTVLFTGTPCQVAAVRRCCGSVGGGR